MTVEEVVVVVAVAVEAVVRVMQMLMEWHSSQLSRSLHRLQIKTLKRNLNVPAKLLNLNHMWPNILQSNKVLCRWCSS
jgi:hypothetical protein